MPRRARRRIVLALAVAVGVGGALVVAGLVRDGDGDAPPSSQARASTTTAQPLDDSPTPGEDAALRSLGQRPVAGPPEMPGEDHGDHEHVPSTVVVAPAEQQALDAALDQARGVRDRYPLVRDAVADGYARGSDDSPGIGVHYVKWSLVGAPFDIARPSMLLYDGTEPDAPLVGLSYWVTSSVTPEGFPGPNDVWHRHLGLCIIGGRTQGENLGGATECAGGEFLAGNDLWMLHAWIVPGLENPDGVFAPRNPAVR